MKRKQIAIIGKYSCGKTTLINYLQSQGFATLKTDQFFCLDYQKDGSSYQLIKQNLGPEFVNEKEVDKTKLRQFITTSKQNQDLLEKLIYPVLEKHFFSHVYDFVEIPNLFSHNANFYQFFDGIIEVKCSKIQQQKNISALNLPEQVWKLNDYLNRKSQIPLRFKNQVKIMPAKVLQDPQKIKKFLAKNFAFEL